jgi:ribulose-5-phosphate 4-epimerase/fuculose-1-phosphate aldolase
MIDERIYEMFREIGRDLYGQTMISSHGGNLSIRLGDKVIIKRRGAMLGALKLHDLIETRIDKNDSGVALASTELLVHRTIYQQTPALAVVHCHPRTAIAFSLSLLPAQENPGGDRRIRLRHTADGEQGRFRPAELQDHHAARARQLCHRSDPG